jgi:hypothetical protein
VSKRNHLGPSVDRKRCDAVHELEDVSWIVAIVRQLAHGGKDLAYPDQPGDLARFLDNARAARHGALIFYFMRHAWFK